MAPSKVRGLLPSPHLPPRGASAHALRCWMECSMEFSMEGSMEGSTEGSTECLTERLMERSMECSAECYRFSDGRYSVPCPLSPNVGGWGEQNCSKNCHLSKLSRSRSGSRSKVRAGVEKGFFLFASGKRKKSALD